MRALIYVVLPKVPCNRAVETEPTVSISCRPDVSRTWYTQRYHAFRNRTEARRFINKAEFRCMMKWLGWEPARIGVDSVTDTAYKQLKRALYPGDSLGATEIASESSGPKNPVEVKRDGEVEDQAQPSAEKEILVSAGGEPLDHHEETLRRYFVSLALPILLRVPLNTPDSHEKRRTAEMNIIYASQLPQTSTPFMVTLEGNGNVLFRLINSRLDELRGACDYLVASLKQYNSQHSDAPVKIIPTIKILEHDLEQSTISGAYRPSWASIIRKYAGVNFALFVVFLAISVGLFAGQRYLDITGSNQPLKDALGKFLPPALSGMLTSLVTLWYTVWDRRKLIDWSFADIRAKK